MSDFKFEILKTLGVYPPSVLRTPFPRTGEGYTVEVFCPLGTCFPYNNQCTKASPLGEVGGVDQKSSTPGKSIHRGEPHV